MVRNYKPKNTRRRTDPLLMKRAVEEVCKGRPVRQVAIDVGVDRITLSRYVKKFKQGKIQSINDLRPNYSSRQVFDAEEESGLEKYILTCSQMFRGLGYEAVRKLAYQYSIAKHKDVPESWKQNLKAGKDWMYGFMRRHKTITLRTPEKTSMARAQGFNKTSVQKFFNLWSEALRDKKFQSHCIYNLDETGITTVQEPPKILAQKGIKQVGQIACAEGGSLVTVCCCVSASGQTLPPAMVFPRVHFKDHMVKGSPPGTLGLATSSGWMNSELFPKVLQHFIKHMRCSVDNPAVLFMDNHESHVGLQVIDMARRNGLTIITFPPHTSHRIQPLDVSVYGPLKTYYKTALNEWNLTNPTKRITIYEIPSCFTIAFNRAMTFENISSGFAKTGIWPLNTEIFTDDQFIAASVFRTMCDSERSPSHVHTQEKRIDQLPSLRTAVSYCVDQPSTSKATASNHGDTSCSSRANVSSTSFEEIKNMLPLPKRQKDRDSILKKKRTVATCKILTSTPEKEKAMRKLGLSTNKKVKPCKKMPSRKNKIPKIVADNEDSSDECSETMSLAADSSCYDDEDESDAYFPSSMELDKEPTIEDFVLVKLIPLNSKQPLHYVGKVVEIDAEDAGVEYDVEFYRQLRKMKDRFVKPDVEEISRVARANIISCLPKPLASGGTKRVASMISFSVNLAPYKCQ